MVTIKQVLDICNEALYYEYNGLTDIEEIDIIHLYIVDNFIKPKPRTNVLESLSIIDDIILKICFNEDVENILKYVDDLRTKIICMMVADKTNTDTED